MITRHGHPAGVLIGFASDDDWFDYQLESDPRFPRRIERAHGSSSVQVPGCGSKILTSDDAELGHRAARGPLG